MELASNCHYKIVSVVCKLYLLGFLRHSMAFNFFFDIQFVIKMRKSLPSILCLQGVFLGSSLINPPPPLPYSI